MSDINFFSIAFSHIDFHHALLLFFLIFTRLLIISSLTPFLGGQVLPPLVRIGLTTTLSIAALSLLEDEHTSPSNLDVFFIGLLFLKEAFIGFILGWFASLFFSAYELFGELIDFSRGANMARLLVPEVKHPSSPMGVFWFQLSLVLFLGLGLHRDVLTAIYQSFTIFHPLSLSTDFLSPSLLAMSVHVLGTLFLIAVKFSLPMMFVCFLIDAAFGLLNRIAPQVNVYFLSLPAKMIGGLIILFFAMPFMLDDFRDHYSILFKFLYQFLAI